MEHVTAVLLIFSMNFGIQSFPIENGFSVKFAPLSVKEDLSPKQFGALFAKIPQEFKPKDERRRDDLTMAYFPQKPGVPTGFTNQVAKLLNIRQISSTNNSRTVNTPINFLNLPIIRQPYDEYKILIATAPPNVNINDKNKRTIIYIIFPDEKKQSDKVISNIPVIYFVNEKTSKILQSKKGSIDPILIVDSNRTVTGLKSKEVAKFVKFKNKLTNRYDYKVSS